MPNPAPPPPSSLPPVGAEKVADAMKKMGKETEDALKALEQFTALQKEVNEVVERQAASLEKTKKLNDDYEKSILNRREAVKKAQDEYAELSSQYAQYRNKDGSWMEGTGPIRLLYISQLKEIAKAKREAIVTEKNARKAVQENVEVTQKEREARENAVLTLKKMEDLRDDIVEVDAAFANDLNPSLKAASDALSDATTNINEYAKTAHAGIEKTLADVAKKAREKEMQDRADVARKEFAIRMANLKEEREARRNAIKVEREDRLKANDEMLLKQMVDGGGIAGGADVKKLLDEFVSLEEERIKKLKPGASDRYIANMVEKAMKEGRAQEFLTQKLTNEKTNELIEIEKKALEKIKEERKVSDTVARQILERQKSDKSSDIHKELKKVNEKSQLQLSQIKNLNQNQLGALQRADMARADDLEAASEAKNRDPIKALDKLGDRFSGAIEALKDTFGSIFKKDDGWLKTIAIVLTIVIGATLGYIWAKIKLIVGILSYIPGIGKYISSGFNALTGAFGGLTKAGGFLSNLAAPFKTLFGVLGKIFPSFAGFGGRLASIFTKSFKVLGPIGLAISTLYDAITGAIHGFKDMGWKGIIMGAIAGIISGLTFGLIDVGTIFSTLKEYFGKFFDAINNIFMAFKWVYEPLFTAFKNIISIFQGEGSIVGKIFKAMWEGFKGWMLFLLRTVLNLTIKLPMIIIKGIYYLIEGIVRGVWNLLNWGIEKIAEGLVFIYDWFASGDWLGDLANLSDWIWDQITGLFGGIMDSVADALGEIPFIGDSIKGFLGGGSEGSEDEVKTTIEKASETTEKLVNETKATKEVVLSLPTEEAAHPLMAETATPLPLATGEMVAVPVTTASATQVARASAQASTAQMAATQGGSQSTAISAPTTNIMGGGGGGEPTVFMGSTSRNNDPTFRALLFLEQPAL